MTIAVRISACGSGLAVGPARHVEPGRDDRRHLARDPAGGEDQQVDGVAEERDAEQHADDVLRQHQIDGGGKEQADEDARTRLPSAVLPVFERQRDRGQRADDDQIDADVEGHHGRQVDRRRRARSESIQRPVRNGTPQGQRQQAGQRRKQQPGAGDRQRMEMQRPARRRHAEGDAVDGDRRRPRSARR